MGSVYQTRHLRMDRFEAVKIMHPRFIADPEFFQRFKREAQSVAALDHPNIVKVYAYGVFGSVPFMAMEYIEGPSLRELLNRAGKLREPLAVSIFLDICAGLKHAHDAGITHRDLKPDNVIVTHTDEGRKAKVVDFGLSKALDARRLTLTGEVIGDPRYMSPEQARGQKLDHCSDIYSMGCLMYEALTGVPPFDAENNIALMYMRLENEPPPFPADVDLPPAYEKIVMKAMAVDKRHRFASVSELAEELTFAVNDNYTSKPFERAPIPEIVKAKLDEAAPKAVSRGIGKKRLAAISVCTVAASAAIGFVMPSIWKSSSKKIEHNSPSIESSVQQRRSKPIDAVAQQPELITQEITAPSLPKTQKGWAFLQKGEQTGTYRIYLTDTGQIAINDEIGTTIVTKAPSWNLAVYNSKTKVYFLSTVKDWQMHFQQNPKYKNRTKFVSNPAPRKGIHSTIAGMRATQYFVDAPINGGARQAEVWVADDVRMCPELSQLNEKMYGSAFGGLGRFPLRFSYIDESGKKTMVMNTTIGRPDVIPTAAFAYPTHFKRVGTELAVFLDDKDRKTMAGILDNLDDPESRAELDPLLGKSGTERTPYGTQYHGSNR